MTEQANGLTHVPDGDLAWCHEAVQDVSRTFAITIDVLEEPTSSFVCVGYLVCRIADTIEDSSALSPAVKADLLGRYDRVLDPSDGFDVAAFADAVEPHVPDAESDDWAVVTNAPRVIETFERFSPGVREAIRPPTRELVGGMRAFVQRYADSGGIRIQSVAELEEYCYYVAGTVGHLVTNLHVHEAGGTRQDSAIRDASGARAVLDLDGTVADRLRATAEEFGLLLQLVNVAKDVYADYTDEDNVYLPAGWLDEVGTSQETVLRDDDAQEVASVVRRTAEHARSYLDDAQTYLETLSEVDHDAFEAWAIPFLLAVGTLRELSVRPADALTPGGVKISRAEVAAVVRAVTVDRSQSLAALRESVRNGQLHR